MDRSAIRTFVAGHRGVLELAQAEGRLARSKLDIKDAAHRAFSPEIAAEERFRSTLDEELEAFCADMRLASVTVQAQVERHKPRWLLALGLAVAVWFVVIFVLLVSQEPSATIGFLVPTIAAAITFFWVAFFWKR